MSAPGANVALEIFPTDAAVELKMYAEKHSWQCAKIYHSKRKKADADMYTSEADNHFASFKDKSKGLLSEKSYQDIQLMLSHAGWHAANTRKSERSRKRKTYEYFASTNKKLVEEHYQNVVRDGEISKTLARNVQEMGWGAAWLAANKIFGHDEDKERQKANVDSYFEKIHGEVNLIDMKFIMDEATIISQKLKLVSEQTMTNNSDIQQNMMFKFSVTEGKTRSTTHSIGFSYGINAGFSAGIPDFVAINFDLSFNFSHDHSFDRSVNIDITKSYEFPLVVPARTTCVAKGMVHEAEMDVPYELVFDFGGAHRSVKGHWKGVVCSKATYKIDTPDTPDTPVPPMPKDDVDSPAKNRCNIS